MRCNLGCCQRDTEQPGNTRSINAAMITIKGIADIQIHKIWNGWNKSETLNIHNILEKYETFC